MQNTLRTREKMVLLTVCGAFVCHADVKSSLLYAALTTEIMLLCYGITQSLTSLDACIEKQIHVSGRVQGDFLMLETRNSFCGKDTFKNGTGLSNIKKVAEKYDGAMSIETQENVFILHVLLVIPQHPDDSSQQMD